MAKKSYKQKIDGMTLEAQEAWNWLRTEKKYIDVLYL